LNTGGGRPTPCKTSGMSLECCVHSKPDSIRHRVIGPLCCQLRQENTSVSHPPVAGIQWRMETGCGHIFVFTEGRTDERKRVKKK
jgi:hypothetical protein